MYQVLQQHKPSIIYTWLQLLQVRPLYLGKASGGLGARIIEYLYHYGIMMRTPLNCTIMCGSLYAFLASIPGEIDIYPGTFPISLLRNEALICKVNPKALSRVHLYFPQRGCPNDDVVNGITGVFTPDWEIWFHIILQPFLLKLYISESCKALCGFNLILHQNVCFN